MKYIRTQANATKYFGLSRGFIFSVHGEGGYIHPLRGSPASGADAVRLTDRFFGAQLRGFDIRGIGPRVVRQAYNTTGALEPLDLKSSNLVSDSLGGRAYYMGRLELEIPLGAGARSLGLRPSAFVDAGSVWGLKRPQLTNIIGVCIPVATNTTGTSRTLTPTSSAADLACITDRTNFNFSPGYNEVFLGNSPKPRLSIGIGVNWTSPFGPLRIDLAKALLKQDGDETKLFSFNVGTQF